MDLQKSEKRRTLENVLSAEKARVRARERENKCFLFHVMLGSSGRNVENKTTPGNEANEWPRCRFALWPVYRPALYADVLVLARKKCQ